MLLVVLAEWLGKKKYFKYLGSSLIVILAAAIVTNLHLLPSARNAPALYDAIFTYIAPLAIFYLLLDVKLADIRIAGLPMISMFLIGSVCTVVGTLIGYYYLAPQNHHIDKAFAVAGLYTGTYIGGSANLNAVAMQYGVTKNGTLFAAINAADSIITAIWIIATLVLPIFLQRMFPRKAQRQNMQKHLQLALPIESAKQDITVEGLSLLLALGIGTLFLSQLVSSYFPQVPMILFLTTVALIFAQVKPLHKVQGGAILGYVFILLFLAVVGAYCDIGALMHNKEVAFMLMAWVSIIVFVHGILLFTIGGLMKQDWYLIAIASNGNIGGATTAGVLATSLNRPELRLPGILAGSIGNALGTYIGILVAEFLR